jgi:hypothetical protein
MMGISIRDQQVLDGVHWRFSCCVAALSLDLVHALQMYRVPIRVPTFAQRESERKIAVDPLRTAVVGPTGEALDKAASRDTPVMVLLHSFDSR